MNDKMTEAEAFESEAVRIATRTAERFQQRLADEQTMADTVAVGSDEELTALKDENALLRRSLGVLNARIEELEAQRTTLRAAGPGDSVTFMTTSARGEMLDRIAYVLRTFYFAELSLSSVQPIISLAMELNPEIIEKKR